MANIKKYRIVQSAPDAFIVQRKGRFLWIFWTVWWIVWRVEYNQFGRSDVKCQFSSKRAAEDYIAYNIGQPVVWEHDVQVN